MSKKASLDDLAELEAKLIEKMTSVFKLLSNEYYNKEEINKKLSILTKRLKEFSVERSRAGSNEREDAMLSKRQLGPVACASCE